MATPRRVAVLLVGGVLLAGIAAWLRPDQAGSRALTLPEQLAGLPRVAAGEQAMAQTQRLHGDAIPITQAAFALYGTSAQVTLWVATAAGELEAEAMVEAMREAIAGGDSAFTPLAPRAIDGTTVYPLRGMGKEHLYFSSGPLVVWLAAAPAIAEAAGQAVVEAYR